MHTSSSSSTSRLGLGRLALLLQRNTFTPEEVCQRLRADDVQDPRTAAVHAAAARTGVWSSLLAPSTAADLGRAGRCLPSIVFWYRQGVSAEEIAQRVSLFGSAWDAERALGVAAELIARTLNSPGSGVERAA